MILNMAISSVFTEVGLQLWMKFRIGVEKMIVGTNILEDRLSILLRFLEYIRLFLFGRKKDYHKCLMTRMEIFCSCGRILLLLEFQLRIK